MKKIHIDSEKSRNSFEMEKGPDFIYWTIIIK